MAIKNVPIDKTNSVYSPEKQAYHEVAEDDLVRQMESLGLSESEIKDRLAKLKQVKGGGV